MSSELERRLREARETLRSPDAAATERARAGALGAIGRRPRRRRNAVAVFVALLVTGAVGIGFGASIAPNGNAARPAVGLGFLPDDAWTVVQSGARIDEGLPALAIASSVPLHPDDAVTDIQNSSGVPYSTLLELPSDGVVIVATFHRRQELWTEPLFPARKLPLRLRDARPAAGLASLVRPEAPLGQYELRAAVNGHNVDLDFYFGAPRPSAATITSAQRQLERLVVRASTESSEVDARAFPLRTSTPGPRSAPRDPAARGTPSQVVTRSCSQRGSTSSIQIAGRKSGNFWLRVHRSTFAAIPDGRTMLALWSFGSQSTHGPVLYGWTTGSRSVISSRCSSPGAGTRPSAGALRPPLRVEDGWSLGRRFECAQRGRFVVQVKEIRGGKRLTIWMERSRELVAVAEIVRMSGWVRASKRCADLER